MAVVGVLAVGPAADASFARRLSGKLSRNSSIATQQLTADPFQVLGGTLGVTYDPSLVSLYFPPDPLSLESARFVESPGFTMQEIRIAVDDGAGGVQYVTPGQFVDTGLPRVELGEIRVSFSRIDVTSPVILPPEPGYGPYVTEPGFQQGDDTFGVIFYERGSYEGSIVLPGAQPVVTPYTVFIPPNETIRVIDDGETEEVILGPDDVTTGTISFPEPASLGLLAIAGIALAARRGRHRHRRG